MSLIGKKLKTRKMLAVTRGDRREEKLDMIPISVETNYRIKFASVRQTIKYIFDNSVKDLSHT